MVTRPLPEPQRWRVTAVAVDADNVEINSTVKVSTWPWTAIREAKDDLSGQVDPATRLASIEIKAVRL